MDDEEIQILVREKLLQEGVVDEPPTSIEDLIFHEYSTEQVEDD